MNALGRGEFTRIPIERVEKFRVALDWLLEGSADRIFLCHLVMGDDNDTDHFRTFFFLHARKCTHKELMVMYRMIVTMNDTRYYVASESDKKICTWLQMYYDNGSLWS